MDLYSPVNFKPKTFITVRQESQKTPGEYKGFKYSSTSSISYLTDGPDFPDE